MRHSQLIVELYWYFKFRYEMLRLHAFWYDLFRLDAICQFMVTRSVTIESPAQIRSIRSHTSEYDYPDRVQDYHDRGSRFGSISCLQIHLDTLQHVHHDMVRSVAVGCGFGLNTFTITIESDHDFSHDLPRQVC